jgi:competence protein ComEA
MRSRPTSAEHQAAVSRRLDLLRAELAASAFPTAAIDPSAPVSASPPLSDEDGWHDELPAPTADGAVPWWSSATRVPGPQLRVVGPHEPHPVETDPPAGTPRPDPRGARVPVPGRHASRRTRELTAWLPETLQGRLVLGPAQLTVVAVLVALGLAVTAWSVVRSAPEAVAPVAAPVSDPAAPQGELVTLPDDLGEDPGAPAAVSTTGAEPVAGSPAASGSSGQAGASITVDVAGKVRRPGIAVLASGARVVDALAAAGGVRGGVDLTGLNLARLLVDGEQILVGVEPPPGVAASALAGGAPTAGVPGALVNLNTATVADLDTLPDVGPVTAQSIIGWREEHGGFTSVDELLEVSGIGEATLSRIAPLVTV